MKRSKLNSFSIASNRIPLQVYFLPCLKMRSISCCLLMISILVRLLLIRNCERVSTLCSSASKNEAAALCCHASAEAKCSGSLGLTWLVSSFSLVTHVILQISSHRNADFFSKKVDRNVRVVTLRKIRKTVNIFV